MKQVQLKDVKKGEFIMIDRFKPMRNATSETVWIKGDYDRSNKDYSIINFGDMNREKFIKPTTKVWIGFTF